MRREGYVVDSEMANRFPSRVARRLVDGRVRGDRSCSWRLAGVRVYRSSRLRVMGASPGAVEEVWDVVGSTLGGRPVRDGRLARSESSVAAMRCNGVA